MLNMLDNVCQRRFFGLACKMCRAQANAYDAATFLDGIKLVVPKISRMGTNGVGVRVRGDHRLSVFTCNFKDVCRGFHRGVRNVRRDAHFKAVSDHGLAKIRKTYIGVVCTADTALTAPNGGQKAYPSGVKHAKPVKATREDACILHGKKSGIFV